MVDHCEQSSLPEHCKTVLRLTDSFILHPAALTDSLVADARSTFSDAQLAEWCLDVTKWSRQKVYVALGTDGRVAGYSPV